MRLTAGQREEKSDGRFFIATKTIPLSDFYLHSLKQMSSVGAPDKE